MTLRHFDDYLKMLMMSWNIFAADAADDALRWWLLCWDFDDTITPMVMWWAFSRWKWLLMKLMMQNIFAATPMWLRDDEDWWNDDDDYHALWNIFISQIWCFIIDFSWHFVPSRAVLFFDSSVIFSRWGLSSFSATATDDWCGPADDDYFDDFSRAGPIFTVPMMMYRLSFFFLRRLRLISFSRADDAEIFAGPPAAGWCRRTMPKYWCRSRWLFRWWPPPIDVRRLSDAYWCRHYAIIDADKIRQNIAVKIIYAAILMLMWLTLFRWCQLIDYFDYWCNIFDYRDELFASSDATSFSSRFHIDFFLHGLLMWWGLIR